MSQGELKNFGRPATLLYDESSVLYELTKKLSSAEKQTIREIVNQNIERLEKSQLTLDSSETYCSLESRSSSIQLAKKNESSEDESVTERKAIHKKKVVSYGATN